MNNLTYDAAKVKQIPITAYLESQNIAVRGNRCAAKWRGGDNLSVSIDADKNCWYDHKENEGGSVIDLAMKIEGLSVHDAINALGQRFGITPDADGVTRRRMPKPPTPQTIDWAKVSKAVKDFANGDASTEKLSQVEIVAYFKVLDVLGDGDPTDVDAAINEAVVKVIAMYKAETQSGASVSPATPPATRTVPAAKVKDWPSDILNPEGLLGEVVRWIRESSGMDQPLFALAAGLTACGSLLGRIVKDYTGQRTNLYTLAIGNSSAGKDDPIKCIQKLMLALDRGILLGGEVTSDSALEILLDVFPSRIMLLDEVGHYLANVKNAGQSNGHLKTVMPMLTKAWSSAHSALQGKARALDTNGKWKQPKTIIEPSVSVYGTTVPNVLFDSMSYSDFADGSIPRFLSFISETRPMYAPRPEIAVPTALRERLLDALHQLGAREAVYLFEKDDAGEKPKWNEPRLVPETDEAADLFAAFEELKTKRLRSADAGDQPNFLFGKSVENARRVALIVAALRNPSSPAVDQYAAEYAVRLVTHSVNDMIGQVRLNVANSKREREVQDVVRAIRRAGAYGITQSDLTRATRSMRRGDRDNIILDLIEAGTIKESEANGRGAKSVTVYQYLG